MNILIDLYDIEIDLERLNLFYNDFPAQNWSLSVKKFGKEKIFSVSTKMNIKKSVGHEKKEGKANKKGIAEETAKTNSKIPKDVKNNLSHLGISFLNNPKFIITIIKTTSTLDIIFDQFYSFNTCSSRLEPVIYELIAQLHGFEACECSGFTVKNKEGEKIQPKETIYIQNRFGIKFPKSLAYSKRVPDNNQPCKKTQIYSSSPILKSLLKNTMLNFVNDSSIYTLSLTDSNFYLTVTNPETIDLPSLETKKTKEIEAWLKENESKITGSLHKIYLESNFADYQRLKFIKKLSGKELTCLTRFLTVVPVFYDERDSITTKLINMLDSNSKNQNLKMETDYLNIKKKHFIDRVPLCSFKAWEKKKNQ